MPSFEELVKIARDQMLDVENPRLTPEARAILRSKLNLPKESAPVPQVTNSSSGQSGVASGPKSAEASAAQKKN